MSPLLVFELPDLVEADAFAQSVGNRGLDSVRRDGELWLVDVQLSPEASDLAPVLRRAEAWLAARDRGGIHFHLDGRAYLLEPQQPAAQAA